MISNWKWSQNIYNIYIFMKFQIIYMANISLRTGDPFLISTNFGIWKNGFVSKYGAENIFYYANPEDSVDEILGTILGWWLFSNKKMVIINNIPWSSDTAKWASEKIAKIGEYIIEHHAEISDDSIICLLSPKPDGRTKIFKDMSAVSSIVKKSFEYSDVAAMDIIKINSPKLSSDVAKYLIYISNGDLFKIYNESYKIWSLDKALTNDDIDNLVLNAKEVDPFGLLGYIIKWENEKIINLINNKSFFSDDISEFLGAVRRTFRIVILYYEACKISSDSKIISEKTKLNPMQSWQLKNNIKWINDNIDSIRSKYQKALDLEYGLKIWLLPKEISWLSIKEMLVSK